ncbi:hypothetical protein BS47DRAFT_1352048 [Hydnum rufescens UP504]|uniref:Uncharacterized protein n=1 Tax=Hydnum rufescens UP504 TaxID=1448309 RepID=A0A9P6AKS7_9AGAM|nr:hypothetical protein BS47DRAFT_1352048 [Hydnum rufescens UP504]
MSGKPAKLMTFKIDASTRIADGEDTILLAPTGSGKTLVLQQGHPGFQIVEQLSEQVALNAGV